MLISIIIPLYNKENCIYNTLQSVLNQTYQNIEVVIIDDGSTDNSAKIVLALDDDRIKYSYQKNGGVSFARNKGFEKATGDWIMFLDADDTLFKKSIEDLIKGLTLFPMSTLISGNYEINAGNSTNKSCKLTKEQLLENPFKSLWQKTWNIRLGSFIVKNNMLDKLERFRSDIIIGEDVIFTDNLIKNCKIAYIPSLIMCYNLDFSALSKKKVPVEQIYEWVMPLEGLNKNNYLYKIYLDKLFRKIINSFIKDDFEVGVKLIIKHKSKIIGSTFYFIQRLCRF
ncbi:glycosyltransferase family 2 protein [Polaribacter sp. Z014]|uniref:glycosyltransferase family 2 protein n=1 Tax=Polaribacter sp. Z014 TaxID=2927126 RepID=UPI0020227935|nr:glycosyltransferase family 2 protein [Polaribacter sp. Z014]MCL7764549.1 glycosyltransferase family 2 protein [Polaribacter sp. Z014]